MSKPQRVVFFTDSLEPSGVGCVMHTLARHLSPERYQLFLVCPDHPGADELADKMRDEVCDIVRLTVRGESQPDDPGAFEALVQQLRDWQPEIFHSHIGATWEGQQGIFAAQRAEVPLLSATEHLPCVLKRESERELRRRANAHLHRIFAVSQSVRCSQIEHTMIPAERIVTVDNGVEERTYLHDRAQARRELQFSDAERLVLFVGRFTEQKDPFTLLHALRVVQGEAQNDGRKVTAVFAGDGPLRADSEQLARELGIENCVCFLGNCDDVPRWMAAADVLAMPSRFEGLPLAALEAMAVGLPVVGCDAAGVRDAVTHDVTGWLAPIEDAAAVARGLQMAFDVTTNRRWGTAARARFLAYFTARHMAQRQDAAYQDLLYATREAAGSRFDACDAVKSD